MNNRLWLGWIVPAVLATCGPALANGLDNVTRATVAIDCKGPGTTGGFVGTGQVIHELGYILTSTTVVPPKSTNIRVHFIGPKTLPGRLVLADEKLELAVIKVDRPADWPPFAVLPLGDSKSARVGQTVITLGDAYSQFAASGKFITSLGILSGVYDLHRQIAAQPVYVGRVLEATATIAPGMDGGPLLDNRGRLLGIISLNVSDARWMGVAVPIDALRDRLAEVIDADATLSLGAKRGEVTLPATPPPGELLYPAQEKVDEQFAAVARKIAGSVVAIDVDRKSETAATSQPATTRPAQLGPPRRPQPRADAAAYHEFFQRPKEPVTGVIVSTTGHVLTSYYNVKGELNAISVILPDGRKLPARLIGYDESQDLAMLKVQASGLTPVRFPQTAPELSTEVITVGRSPDPAQFTMTRGIISAVGRLNGSTLQIDAATNYANSGGPVVDADGVCVGLVAHVNPEVIWGQNSGIGFAVAGPTIDKDLPALMAGRNVEKVKRGFLGVTMGQGRTDQPGVSLGQVQSAGPADRAGLKDADVITELDGQPVSDAADLQNLIAARKPGQTVHFTVRRGDKTLSIDVVLGERPY